MRRRAGTIELSRNDRAVLDALLPAGASDRLPLGVMETRLESTLDRIAAGGPGELLTGFGLALFAAAWVSPLLIGRSGPFGRLAAADRERALEAMARSRVTALRQLLRMLKTVVALHYGALPEVRRALGYHA